MDPASSINAMLVISLSFFGLTVFRIHSIGVWWHLKLPFWCFTIRDVLPWCGTIADGVKHTSWAHFNLILSERRYSWYVVTFSYVLFVVVQSLVLKVELIKLIIVQNTWLHLLPSHLPWLQCFKGGLEHTDRDSAAGDKGDGVFQWFQIRGSWHVPSLFRREFMNRTEGIWLKVHDSKVFSSFESYTSQKSICICRWLAL